MVRVQPREGEIGVMPKRTLENISDHRIVTASPNSMVWDHEVPGFGLRVTPGGARTFIFQFRTRDHKKQGCITIGSYPSMGIETARSVAACHRSSVDLGGDPSTERKDERAA